MKLRLCLSILALAMASSANAQSLLIDVQPTGGTTAAGYSVYEATNSDTGSIAPATYSAFGGTDNISLSLSIANLPDGDATKFRAVARNGAADDKNNDWLGLDTRPTSSADATMTFTIGGLPAGMYNWTSFHHDGGTGSTNGNIDGLADYSFTDASGVSMVPDGLEFSREDMGQPVFSLNTTIVSDGNDVLFSMIKDFGQGDANDSNAIFAYVGAIEISQVPEPGSFVLFGLGLLGLLGLGRRR